MIVFDASLAVKWFLEELGSGSAQQLLESHSGEISVPDLFVVEVMAVLVRNANMQKTTQIAIREHIEDFAAMFSTGIIRQVQAMPPQITSAANLAIDLGHPLKDCIYLALAMELGCELATCDARFAAKAKGVWDRVRVLGAQAAGAIG
jgi:predicted nucleic acid-binding protein